MSVWQQEAAAPGRPAARLASRAEIAVVALMALGFGLVGFDRFLITTLYPVIARDLRLGYDDIGTITGALALAWGVSALFMGNLSDRIGRRSVLAGSLLLFSLLIGASGLAGGLAGLVAVRLVMGLADGAYTPASITATIEASPPRRHGLNIGIQQTMLPLCGLGVAPLLVTWLLHYIDWRLVFLVFVIPGLLLAVAVWRVMPQAPRPAAPIRRSSLGDWRAVLGYRNVRLGPALMLCWLTCLISTSAFMPNYLVDGLGLPFGQMGIVMSAIGLGSMVGTLALPALSDLVGRKPVMVGATLGAVLSLILLACAPSAAVPLFAALFMVHFFNNALITLTVGPLCTETVPPALIATASGLVIAVGELFGGALAPVVVGQVAQHFGIAHVLWLPIAMMGVGVLLSLATVETRKGPGPA